MRHISLDAVFIPPEWDEYVEELLNDLRNKPYRERSKALGKYPYQLWSVLRDAFEKLSYGKCFYTEHKFQGALPDLDHFRPKGRVAKCDSASHQGYWWLAFAQSNLRLSAPESNRYSKDKHAQKTYGKGTRFPLVDDNVRARIEADPLTNETILLLDPTEADDVKLLCFDDDGVAQSAVRDSNSVEYKRVQASIECYSLNRGSIAKRRGIVCRDAKKWVAKLEHLEQTKLATGAWDKNELRDVVELKIELHSMVQPHAEFSAAVRCVLQNYRHIVFVKDILEN